jgi:simple sugar transport system substrate-binding protein
MKKNTLVVVFVFVLAASFVFSGGIKEARAEKKLVFATVVKSIAFNWFKRLETGVLEFGNDYGVKAFMEGPSVTDSSQQIAIIEDLIAQGVDAITNVPYGVREQEPVQKKAMDAGIIVVTHEAAFVKNAHYDVEAFDNASYGEEIMRELAARMGKKGKYVQFVGSLTNDSHNEWTDAALAYQKANYPDMEFIGKYESEESHEVSYNIIKDMLKTHPDLKGVQGSSAYDVVGAGRVVEELGLSDKIAVVGTSIPSYSGELLKTGAIDLIMAWDPATAGFACNVVAYKILKGQGITDGMDLGVPGYEKIKLVTNESGTPIIYGSAWIKMDPSNMDNYPF